MNLTTRRARRGWPLALTLLTLTSCASSTQNTPRNDGPTATPTAAAPAPLPATQEPEALAALVHLGPISTLASRVGAMVGAAGPQFNAAVDELLSTVTAGDTALAQLIDRDQPVHVAVVIEAEGPVIAASVGAPSFADFERRLGQSHRFGDRSVDGVRTIDLRDTVGGANEQQGQEESEAPSTPRRRAARMGCVVAETGQGNATRLVCSQRRAALPPIAAWLARGISVEVPANVIRAELRMDTVRARVGPMANAMLANASGELVTDLVRGDANPLRVAAAREPLTRIANELVGVATSLVNDLHEATLTVTLDEDRATLRGDATVRASASTLVRALVAATQGGAAVPGELTGALPGGGFTYGAVAVDMEPLRPFARMLAELVAAVARGEGRDALRPAEATALERAMTAVIDALGASQSAAASGADAEGVPWGYAVLRYPAATGPTGAVAGVRGLLAAARRPAVARRLGALLANASGSTSSNPPDLRRVRDVTIRGLPAGSYAFVAPRALVPQPMGSRARAAAAADNATSVVALVPQGNDLRVIVAADNAGVLARVNNTPPAQPAPAPSAEAWEQTQGFARFLFVPAGVPNVFRANSTRRAERAEQGVAAMPSHGTNPVRGFSGVSVEGDSVRVFGTLVVPQEVVGLLGRGQRSSPPSSGQNP